MSTFTCQYCGKDTSEVDIDYLYGTDHLGCALEAENKALANEIELCVICGEKTNYTRGTHIDFRSGYVEGAGQLCDKCWNKSLDIEEKVYTEVQTLGTPFPDRRLLVVEVDMIKRTSNDQELGAKVRQLYYETYNNG